MRKPDSKYVPTDRINIKWAADPTQYYYVNKTKLKWIKSDWQEIQGLKWQVKWHIKEAISNMVMWGIHWTSNVVSKRGILHTKMTTDMQNRKRKAVVDW